MIIIPMLSSQASANTVRLGLISGAEDMKAVGVQVYWQFKVQDYWKQIQGSSLLTTNSKFKFSSSDIFPSLCHLSDNSVAFDKCFVSCKLN